MRTRSQIIISALKHKLDKKQETLNSDTLAMQQQPFSCSELCYSSNGRRKGKNQGGERKKEKKLEDLSLSCSLAVSFSLSACSPSPKFDY